MRVLLQRLVLVSVILGSTLPVMADDVMIDDFRSQPETRWRFFTDTVMGGVSTGQVSFQAEDGVIYARMTGNVSTENRGGFIQMRTELPSAAPADASGVRLVVRGNDQRYFVHLRTRGTVLPWQYYQAGFDVTRSWTEVRLPFAAFEASGSMLRSIPRTLGLKSIAIAAFGRDHAAEIDVREVGFY